MTAGGVAAIEIGMIAGGATAGSTTASSTEDSITTPSTTTRSITPRYTVACSARLSTTGISTTIGFSSIADNVV